MVMPRLQLQVHRRLERERHRKSIVVGRSDFHCFRGGTRNREPFRAVKSHRRVIVGTDFQLYLLKTRMACGIQGHFLKSSTDCATAMVRMYADCKLATVPSLRMILRSDVAPADDLAPDRAT